jgi:D-lactate dehydrogenase
MTIAFYEIADWEAIYIKQRLDSSADISFFPVIFSETDLPNENVEVLSTFTSSQVTEKVLQALPNLKLIVTRTTGFDHIDLKACEKHGVTVCNVPTYGENTVAEFAFALLLSLSRKIYPSVKRVREEGRFDFEQLRGFDLKNKTLGVIGTGHIGTYMVKIAHGFGMNIIAHDLYPNPKLAEEFGFVYATLDDLLAKSDVISLHLPYMESTHHIISKNNISKVKPGAVLINTARGGLVETEAMVDALKQGILSGVGLDVIEEEGFIKEEMHMILDGHPNEAKMRTILADHELMHMENVLITPHNAFQTTEAIMRILDTTVGNIQSWNNNEPKNIVKINS